jgi:N-acetylmuramoyl-L-alanine amidase
MARFRFRELPLYIQMKNFNGAYATVILLTSLLSTHPDLCAVTVVDYQHRLGPRFQKKVREETRFIIIHSTEGSLPSALLTLSRGKIVHGRYMTRGGHAHYLIAKDGTIYRLLDPTYWANHAGVSMWNGLENLSDYSVGVELEGYHDVPFKAQQYQSLKWLLAVLKKRYGIMDRDVLEHYRIAYSLPNQFHPNSCRGRKSDPGISNFNRLKAGLTAEYLEDPDVIAGRVLGTVTLTQVGWHDKIQTLDEDEGQDTVTSVKPAVISFHQTAWKIAGNQYKASSTLYRFPDGTFRPGDQIEDWADIPLGTEVRLGMTEPREAKVVNGSLAEVVIPEVTPMTSPWKIANVLSHSSFTFYIYPDNSVHSGNTLSDMVALPTGTKVLVAYRQIPRPQTRNELGEDLDEIYLNPHTVYLFQNRALKSGNQIEDFTKLSRGTLVFAKLE